ncbi:Negative regulator of sexual conjugation and meiosis [Psilocybe cubensis]|uniref:Protein kinase domain-containing protein n=2 Tax=Psilocybe cubensis TaxID=181762 RepID=A0A8H7XWE3_PSICU|nr:Negative regulator of sexual conjugation and meiosis [Psilocybe cubensis]KAH9478444.1 Negative regulator of sexual conjugation and meiosis [Psilocybe cubensis]
MPQKAPVSAPASHPPLGTLIDGNALQLVEVLGVGGYGVVYRAVETFPSRGRSFAVKCLASTHSHSVLRRQVHIREITLHRIASVHPGVVTLHRIVEDHDHMFIIMEYAPDDDLFTQILHKSRYLGNNALIKHVFLQLIDGVQHCHSLGIFHRDLKPENILCFDGGYRVAITDFGLATTDKMSKEFRTGSVYHMSPAECQAGDPETSPAYSPMHNDIWSLGIILLNLVTGRNPWRSAMADDPTYQAYRQDPLQFLMSVLPISEELNDILVQTLDVDWRGRLSLSELRQSIQNVTSFYSDKVIFEGSLARCPWEAGMDLGNVEPQDAGHEKRPVPKIPEGVEPYCVLSVSAVASTFKSQASTTEGYFERDPWKGEQNVYDARHYGMDVYDNELQVPYGSSGRSSYSSDPSEPSTPSSVDQFSYRGVRNNFDMETAYDYDSENLYAKPTAYPSFTGSSATETPETNRYASSVFVDTPIMESKPFLQYQDAPYMDAYRTAKRYSSPNTSIYSVTEDSIYGDDYSDSSVDDFPPNSPNFVVWPEPAGQRNGSRPMSIQNSRNRKSRTKSQNVFNPMRFFPRSSGSSWLSPKSSPLASRPITSSAGTLRHNATPSNVPAMPWTDYHHPRSGHKKGGNSHRYPAGGYGTQRRSSRDWIPGGFFNTGDN